MTKASDLVLEGQRLVDMKPSRYKYWKSANGFHIFKNEDGVKEAFGRHKYPIAGWQLRVGNTFFEFAHTVGD